MPKFTNISDGPRGIHTASGLVTVEAGETVDVELAKGEDIVEEWFEKAKGSPGRPPADKSE